MWQCGNIASLTTMVRSTALLNAIIGRRRIGAGHHRPQWRAQGIGAHRCSQVVHKVAQSLVVVRVQERLHAPLQRANGREERLLMVAVVGR